MKSIRTKLIVTVIFFLAVGIGGLSLVSFFKTKQLLTTNLEQTVLSSAQSYSRETGLWMDARKAEISMLANSRLVIGGGRESATSYLNDEAKRTKMYEMFFVSDKKGEAYTSTGTTANVSDRDYFKEVMEGKTVVSDPVISKASAKMIVVVASPIYRNGKIDGVIGGTVLVEDLSQKVMSLKMGKTGYAYMSQGNGLMIAHPNKGLVMKYNPLLDKSADTRFVEAAKKMTAGETGISRYIFEDVDKYVGYAPVPGTKWSLAVTAPMTELSEQLASLPVLYLTISLVFGLIITIILALFLSRMLGNLRRVAVEAVKIADGDLTGNEIPIRTNDEMGQLASAFNTMLANLKDITAKLQEKSRNVAASATQLMASAENVSAGAMETANTINQVASSVDRVTNNARQISASSEQAAGYARDSADGVRRIISQMDAIQRATSASGLVINGLNQSAGKITQIVEMITQIADQTNLLALNAAIEAARAGEQGRGFAVVAEEVRGLSEQSASAAKEIHNLIIAIQQESNKAVQSMSEGSAQVNAGSKVVQEVGGTLEKIITSVQGLAGEIQSIATAIDDISSAVENVAAASQQQTATMEEVSSTTEHLTSMSEELEDISKRFKLS